MKTYLIETDILIDLFNKRDEADTLITELSKIGRLVSSAVTVAELRAGWDDKKASFYLPKLYAIVEIVDVTKEVAEYAGSLRNAYGKKGQVLPTIDTLIAATCINNAYTLVTRNIRHYPMNEIDLYNIEK
ncbi:MAG TPA: type II toxin-antitoxin system VapC family toxin [Candidatus Saccharimonadales bacterium]|nr:type II toxin-antitoxin system VapC family toxin [Candidatus Saccharimonadales bacterium]